METYQKRLEHRIIDNAYFQNYEKKMKLWELRFETLKMRKSQSWTSDNLCEALKSLKKNKTRDPCGLINELFKPPVMGEDLKGALLKLVNGVKDTFIIPAQVEMANITTIFKKKGSKFDLENYRGIFGLSVYKKIIDKLTYKEKYPLLDKNMSDSNIGARRKKNISNHLFIVYGVINSVIMGESKCVDIHIYDLVKAFDVLWLQDSMNDLWDTLPEESRDDRLGLVYETCRTNRVAIKTSVGLTDRKIIPEIVTQGGTWGPMMCSNTIDTVGKFCQANGNIYKYKNVSRVIPLAMVDDLLTISSCGFQTVAMNTTLNTLIELKKLRFHTPVENKKSKCHSLHIGKPSKWCPEMKVHGKTADRVAEALYLGDIVSEDGKNTKNIRSRVSKGMGIVTEILDTLNTVSFGANYFQIATVLREARLINGMLTNCEVWYGLQKGEIDQLEEVDKLLLRRILKAPNSACIESLYLELGITPIRGIIKSRRINRLHYLANLNKEEMLYKFFLTQWMYPVRNDWVHQVREDLADFNLEVDLDQLTKMSKNVFKKMVKKKLKEYSLGYLTTIKEKHSKMDQLVYPKLKIQNYLKDRKISVQAAKSLFRWRTRSALFKTNFGSSYLNTACPYCNTEPSLQYTIVNQKN